MSVSIVNTSFRLHI